MIVSNINFRLRDHFQGGLASYCSDKNLFLSILFVLTYIKLAVVYLSFPSSPHLQYISMHTVNRYI